MITTSNIQRVAISAVGALLLSSASVLAAVSPAKAETANAPLTVGDWQQVVETEIDRTMRMPSAAVLRPATLATVRVSFDADGAFKGATLAESTGDAALDREAIRTASKVSYPALPSGLRGRPQTVEMKLFFGSSANDVMAARRLARTEAQASADRIDNDNQIAALPTG